MAEATTYRTRRRTTRRRRGTTTRPPTTLSFATRRTMTVAPFPPEASSSSSARIRASRRPSAVSYARTRVPRPLRVARRSRTPRSGWRSRSSPSKPCLRRRRLRSRRITRAAGRRVRVRRRGTTTTCACPPPRLFSKPPGPRTWDACASRSTARGARCGWTASSRAWRTTRASAKTFRKKMCFDTIQTRWGLSTCARWPPRRWRRRARRFRRVAFLETTTRKKNDVSEPCAWGWAPGLCPRFSRTRSFARRG
mmetsp:Transcript_3429/g.13832  ORF Transcript_3429/g.13832 Transcript_3429/m.13832 type:complete len:252 (-) Transcript_3429:663-1418(-)